MAKVFETQRKQLKQGILRKGNSWDFLRMSEGI